jgi:adenylate cyclase
MPIEIERKFLVVGDSWRHGVTGTLFRQGYLCTDPERTVRVRLAGGRGTLTIKGKTEGISRAEFEYPIPAAEAAELLDRLCLCPLI